MSRHIIAIDFDDVIVETGAPFLQHYKEVYGVDVDPKYFYSYDTKIWGVEDRSTIVARVEEYLMSKVYQDRPIAAETVRAIKKISKSYELHVVTGRSSILSDLTRSQVSKYFPGVFQSIEFTDFLNDNHRRTKSEVCRQIGASILIDDHIHHAEDVVKIGAEVLLFGDYAWNQSDDLVSGVRRVKDWDEVTRLLLV